MDFGMLLAKTLFSQSAAPAPLQRYLAKFEMSMMPAFARSILHSSPTGPPPILAGEPIGVFGVRCICEPQRVFPAKVQAHNRAHVLLTLIHGACAHGAPCTAFLVREVDFETVGILVAHPFFW